MCICVVTLRPGCGREYCGRGNGVCRADATPCPPAIVILFHQSMSPIHTPRWSATWPLLLNEGDTPVGLVELTVTRSTYPQRAVSLLSPILKFAWRVSTQRAQISIAPVFAARECDASLARSTSLLLSLVALALCAHLSSSHDEDRQCAPSNDASLVSQSLCHLKWCNRRKTLQLVYTLCSMTALHPALSQREQDQLN